MSSLLELRGMRRIGKGFGCSGLRGIDEDKKVVAWKLAHHVTQAYFCPIGRGIAGKYIDREVHTQISGCIIIRLETPYPWITKAG